MFIAGGGGISLSLFMVNVVMCLLVNIEIDDVINEFEVLSEDICVMFEV